MAFLLLIWKSLHIISPFSLPQAWFFDMQTLGYKLWARDSVVRKFMVKWSHIKTPGGVKKARLRAGGDCVWLGQSKGLSWSFRASWIEMALQNISKLGHESQDFTPLYQAIRCMLPPGRGQNLDRIAVFSWWQLPWGGLADYSAVGEMNTGG